MRLLVAAAVFALALPLATPAEAQRRLTDVPATWQHKDTGMRFPDALGEFRRISVVEYDVAGSNVSVGYELVRDGAPVATVTVYLYPAPADHGCATVFETMKQAIVRTHPATLVEEGSAASPTGRSPQASHRARYRLEATYAGTRQPLLSEAYLHCAPGGAWNTSYRASWPEGADVEAAVATLHRSLDWVAPFDR